MSGSKSFVQHEDIIVAVLEAHAEIRDGSDGGYALGVIAADGTRF